MRKCQRSVWNELNNTPKTHLHSFFSDLLQLTHFNGAIPPGKHVMFSYNSNSENVVSKIYQLLQKENIPVWFDRNGDQKDCMYKRYEYKDFTYIYIYLTVTLHMNFFYA